MALFLATVPWPLLYGFHFQVKLKKPFQREIKKFFQLELQKCFQTLQSQGSSKLSSESNVLAFCLLLHANIFFIQVLVLPSFGELMLPLG
jgi:hypothetical protein